ncbi:MAG TPA: acyl-CoA thioesterase domain-containing protein [Ramlibacter sp.]|nr:acyl-CoA thioesterase domain-containing protein [Ramlibacter sp.]
MALIPAWSGSDIAELFAMDETAPLQFRTRFGNPNKNGRTYGGQLLALALMAAARTVPIGRAPTVMQFMYLQGTRHDEALGIHVTPLQDGKRFSSRHVRGAQGGERLCFDAQVSFAAPMTAPSHGAPPGTPLSDPDTLPRIDQYPSHWSQALVDAVGYPLTEPAVIDFRLDDPPERMKLDAAEPRLRFWLRTKKALPDDPHLHAAAFAYMSDWWINYSATGAHQDEAIAAGGLYVASLNHSIWLHMPFRSDEWLHFESVSPAAAFGRGFCVARVHDRAGQLVASVTQECVMGMRG